ncbi:hypothetical protein WCE37_03790 [Luteimonas sp. MJ250]|uniref:hypothetical protein n=1 Tax=Luteimonas sp. MJ250 TaxID=3129236 RepID=UPI0031BA4E24
MDSKDRKPARPSLFESGPAPGGQEGARAAGGRLDVELAGQGSQQQPWPRFLPWVLAAGLAAIGIAGWAALSDRGSAESMQVAHAPLSPSGVVDRSSTAVLVDGGTAHGGQPSTDDPLSNIGANAEAGEAGTDLASRLGLNTEAAPATTASRGGTSASARRTARPRAQTADEKADLLAVLMANIREQPDKAHAGGTGPQTLDELVAQLSKAPSAEPGSSASSEVAVANQSSANLQRQLRSCPAANTTAGIRCRQKLCAKHRGDPACPMQ